MEECILWPRIAQQFRESCAGFDGLWIKRRRSFNTENMVKSLLLLVGGAQQAYCRVLDQLGDSTKTPPAASSFCEARTRFPHHLIGEIRRDLLEVSDDLSKNKCWNGYRLFAVDGTKVSLPRPLLEYGFKSPSGGHCPQALVSLLLRLEDRLVVDIRLSKKENERQEAHEHLVHLNSDDLVIYDRGYLSFALLQAHFYQKVEAVFRVSRGITFKPIEKFWKSKKTDAVVTINPTSVTYRSSRKKFPEYQLSPLKLRLIKYKIENETYVLATTILDRKILSRDFTDIYSQRWKVEETFKAFKQTLEFEIFHSKVESGIHQEVEATALFWNITRYLTSAVDHQLKKNA